MPIARTAFNIKHEVINLAQPKYVYETTFLVKRGTKEQWEKENPVLECGEIGYVIDENSIKIGDGSSYWTELGYVEDERLSEYGRVTAGQAEGVKLGKKATSEGDQTQATGETAHAEGNKTIASARGAHAQGNSTEASGKYSHAEGEKSKAIGDMSHAAGSKSTAEGKYSHAEGRETATCDTADGAHAEGYQTETEAPYSHVEGYKTEIASSAKYSHAEGSEAAISDGSEGAHAEGKGTEIDDASYSHAEGYASRTLSQYSHAEGIKTIAGGDDSESDEGAHAEGNETMALARCAHSEGDNTEAQGKYSHAEGLQSISYGEGSHAEGVRTQAYGEASHSAGDRTIAWGDYSHAEGLNDETVSVVNLNNYYKIESDYNLDYLVRNSTPLQLSTSCSQLQVGSTILVDGKSAVIERIENDSYSPTYGPSRIKLNRPAGTYVKVVDLQLHKNVHGAIGKASHSEGYYTQAIGDYSHAEGGGTDAIGGRSHAEGDCTEATGYASHAEGEETKAYGYNSHAEGGYTEASGERSHAEGADTTASGDYSHAEGESSIASGYASHAGGIYTIAAGEAQHVSGKYNIKDDDDRYAFIIGNGTSDSERNNAFMVEWNGDAKLDGYLDVLGLKGDTVTRNLYVGGARKANGEWQPDGGFVVDHTPLNSTIKNEAYISTLKVNEEGNYALTAPNGSNNLYKIQVIEDGNTKTLNINQLPIITAGTYSDGYDYSAANGFWITFGSKTKIEAHNKTFTDGTTCYKRLSYQQGLKYDKYDSGENPYPAVTFYTNGPATIKIWWVAGDANRYFAIQHRRENSGSARLEVTGNFVAHGPSDFRGTAVFDDVEIDGRLETSDIHVHGFIETSESIECGGSIKVESEIKAGGTATFENDVKIKNNSNREHTVKLRDALHEALDFDFKKRIPICASEIGGSIDLKTNIDNMRNISATTLTLDQEEYTFDIGDEPIEIWKDFTLKGINEKPVIINFNYTGTASDFTIFKTMAPDLKISFENVVIAETIQPWNVTSIFFQNNGQTGTKISIKNCQINGDDYLSQDFTKCCGRWNVDGAESLFIQDTIINKAAFIGTVGYFDGGNNNLLDSISYGCFYYLNPRERVSYFCDYGATTEGVVCQAIGHGSHAEGHATQAISKDNFDGSDSVEWQFAVPAHAEGESTKAHGGGAHAEGVETQALSYGSHAEGWSTTASGEASHAEGYYTTALGYSSHAEGYLTTASSYGAHAEGYLTAASGQNSHAEGYGTTASGERQHAQGKYNVEDAEGKYAHIVGNGTSQDNRSNAHTVDWDGNAWYAGNIYIGGTSQDDENAKKLATEEFVTNALSGVEHPTPDLTGYATEEFVNTAIQQNAYTLPTATAEAIGGVKVGDTLEISADGALNVKQTETPTELYLMSPGGLKFKITVSDVGELSAEQVV